MDRTHRYELILGIAVIGLGLFYLFGVYLIETLDFGDPVGPKFYPALLGTCVVASGLVITLTASTAHTRLEDRKPTDVKSHPLPVACVLGGAFFYILLMDYLGYLLATFLFLLGMTSFFNKGKWGQNVFTAVAFPAFIYLTFARLAEVNLPKGPLPF